MAITFNVGFQVDSRELRQGLAGIQQDIQNAFSIKGGLSTEIQQATKEAMLLEQALKRATTDKGISYYSLTSELNKAGSSAKTLITTLAAGGENFKNSLNAANTALALSNRQVISLSAKIKEMSRVMTQSFKFTAAQTTLQAISNAAREAYIWVEDLNKAITNIGVVTGKTAGELDRVTESAIKGAKELRIAAKDYAEGQLIFYQQGLGDDEVQRRTEITVKAAAAANQSMSEMSSQLTAIWNTYQMGAEQQAVAASVGAKMAAETAVDFADIAEAMQTAAAPAAQMGVSYNSLAAIISTVGDTTQQSASVIGNAFKTIFSRFQQLKAEGTDGEVTLNRVSQQLQDLGVNVLDSAGELRNLDSVIQEVGNKWDSWSSKQQLAIAQLVGGTRQYGQFLALMQNFSKYQNLLSAANTEDGSALEAQYEASLDSIESYALNAGEAWNRAFSNAFDEDAIKGFYALVEDVGNLFDSIMDSIGGLPGILLIAAGLFSSKIVPALQLGTKNAKAFVTSLTPNGRVKNINNEYDSINQGLQERIATTQQSASKGSSFQKQQANTLIADLQLEQKKNEFSRQTALINEKINNSLKNATGTYKLNLQYQQQQLKSAQELYQASLDQVNALQREAEKRQDLIKLQATLAQAEATMAGKKYDEAVLKVAGAEQNYEAARQSGDAQAIRQAREELKAANAELDIYRQKMIEANMKSEMFNSKSVQDFRTQLSQLTIEYGKLVSTSEGSLTQTEAAFKRFGDTLRATNPELKELVKQINVEFGKSKSAGLGTANTDIQKLSSNSEQAKANVKEINAALKSVAEGSKTVDQAVAEIQELGACGTDTANDIEKIIQNYLELRMQSLEKAIADMNELGMETEQAVAAQEELLRLRSMAESGANAGQARNRQSLAEEGANAQAPSTAGLSNVVGGLGQLTSGASMAAGGISMLSNALKGLEDDSMSAGEALLSLIGGLGMILPSLSMLKGGFSAFQTGMTSLIPALGTASTAASGFGASVAGSFGAAIGAALPFIAIIGVAIGVIAALAFAWKEYKNSTPEAQLEKTKEAAEGLATAAEEAKTAADNLRSSIEGYDSAVATLNDCVVGTEEWEQALKAANEAAKELIKNLPDNTDLQGLYSRNADTGLIEFDQQKLNDIQKQADMAASKADYAASIGEISVQQKTNAISQKNLADSISRATGFSNSSQYTTGSSSYAVNKVIEEHLQELGNTLDAEEFKEKLKDFGLDLGLASGDFESLHEQTVALAQAQANAAEKAELFAQMKVDEILGDDFSAEAKQIAGEALTASTEDWEQKYLGALTNGKFGSSDMAWEYGDIYQAQSKINPELLSTYNSLTGKNWQSSGNGVQGTDSNRIFEFINEEGEIVQLRAEQVAAEMAAAKALEEVTGSAENAAQALAMIKNDSENFNNFITNGNFNSMTEDELTSNFGDDMVASEEEAKAYLTSVFGSEEELEKAAELMGKDVDTLVKEIISGTEVSASALENMGNNLGKRARKVFEEADLSGVEIEAQKKYTTMMERAFTSGGTQGGEYLNTFIEGLQDGAEKAGVEMTDVFNELDTIDWSHITPEQLAEQLESLGIETDDLIDQMPHLIELMNQAANVDFSSAQSHFKTLSSFMDAQFGDIIEQEEYDTLSAKGQEYFQLMADGTYQLIGDAQEFQNLMKNEAMSQYDQLVQQNAERIAQIQNIQDNADAYNYSDLSKSSYDIGSFLKNGFGLLQNETPDYEATQRQLDYLRASGWADQNQSQMREWEEGLSGQDLSFVEYQQIAQAIKDCGDQTENWTQKTRELEEAQKEIEQMQDATRIQGDIQESGISYDDMSAYRQGLQQLIETQDDAVTGEEEYSEALLENENLMNEVAKEQARFTQGLQTAGENMEDWKSIWDDNGTLKDYQKFSDSLEDMRSAYSDLLDVDASSLSEDFLANAENMKLMEQVLTGSSEEAAAALKKLQENAILELNLEGLDPTQISTYVQEMQSVLSNYGAGIEIPLNEEKFYTALNAMIAACGTDMAAIEALCNNLNIEPLTSEDLIPNEIGADVEADTTTVESEGKSEATSYDAVRGTPLTMEATIADGSSPIDVGSGTIARISIPTWDYVPKKETEETTQEVPVTSYKIKPGTGVTKTSSNKQKVANSTPPTPTSYRGGASKPSSSGGGGSGSTPKFNRQTATKTHARNDRYEDINKAIEENTRSLDKLSDAADDAFGIAKLRNLQKINTELQKQGGLLNQLRAEAARYMPIDKKALENAYNEIWTLNENLPKLNLIPFEYNEEGFVTNWEKVSQPIWDNYIKAEEEYYNLVNSYNDKGVGNEAAEEEINAAKEYADQWKSIYEYMSAAKDQVNDTAQQMADALEQALENIREWMSNKLEEAAWKMELQVAISENDISLMDYFIDKWGDLGIQTGKTWDWLNKSNQANMDMLTETEAHAERLLEILNNIDPQNPNADWFSDEAQFGDAWNEYINGNYGKPEEIIEALQDDFDSMLGYIDSMYSNAEEMLSQYIDTLDLYMDKFDRIANKISANNDRLQMFQELLEFSGKQYTQAGRQAMKDLADASVSNAATEVYRAQAALDVAKKGAEDAQGQLEDFLRDAGDDPTQYSTSEAFVYNKLKEAADSAQEVLESAQGDMTSAIQDLASAAADAIEQVAQVIKQEVVENLGGDFADFGSMTEMYDQQYDLDHFFLEDYDKNYQLNKLLGQIDDQMADITDPSRLEEYKALIDEINAANAEGVEITQTDIDLLNAKFELQKAQDAYEEAQNAKNTMRLARDASGNWSYVYSTDTEQTEDAAQKLADAQYNYDKLLHEARDESSQLWIQAQQEFFEFQESIDQARYASDEKYRNQIDQQMAYYQEKTRLYSDQVIKYNDMLGDNFEDTSLGIITNYDSMESAQSVYTEQHKIYHEQLEENTAKYGDMVKDVCEDVGLDYDNLEKTISEEAKLIKEENNQLKNNIDSLRQEAIKDLDAINQKVGPWRVEFCRQMELAEAAVMKVYNALQKLNNMSLDQANTGFNANRDYTSTGYNALIAAGIDPTDEEAIRNFFENTEEGRLIAAEWANKVNSDEMAEAGHAWAQGGDYWNGPVDQEDFINAMINAGYDSNIHYDEGDTSDASNQVGNMGSVLEDLLKQILNNGLSTGGLVKKPSVHSIAENGAELVLNPVDTQNILDAVAHMREVVKMRINNASASLDRKAVETTSKAPVQETTQMVDQQVHIDATFPNVSVAAEIEEAFNNLINQAVQYSSQKK